MGWILHRAPGDPAAALARARHLKESGQLARAEALLRDLLQCPADPAEQGHPSRADVCAEFADLFLRERRVRFAAQFVSVALRHDPGHAHARRLLPYLEQPDRFVDQRSDSLPLGWVMFGMTAGVGLLGTLGLLLVGAG